MTVTRRPRTQSSAINPYQNLVADVIISAYMIVTNQTAANEQERQEALEFIHSEKCHRWAGVLGIDWGVVLRKSERNNGGRI